MSTMQADRRPAIWPWLVMPLIALTAFYCLDRLYREVKEQADLAPAPVVSSEADTYAPADSAEASTYAPPDSSGTQTAPQPSR